MVAPGDGVTATPGVSSSPGAGTVVEGVAVALGIGSVGVQVAVAVAVSGKGMSELGSTPGGITITPGVPWLGGVTTTSP
jgi:hypothetical protein